MRRHTCLPFRTLITLCLLLIGVASVSAQAPDYSTGFTRWRGAENGFVAWQFDGVVRASDGTLRLSAATAHNDHDPYAAGSYYGHSFYNGGSFLVGEAISPAMPTPFAFREAVASWNAETSAGTWIETQIRVQLGDRWTNWYNLGVWAADSSTIERHSVKLQSDADGDVAVDTLVLSGRSAAAHAFQLKLRLFSKDAGTSPIVHNASVAFSTTPVKKGAPAPGAPGLWDRALPIPACSQMVYAGGNGWCSPTSTSMVAGYWTGNAGQCETRVRAAVAGVYDWLDHGYGNWSFNTAYAATQHLEGYVVRFSHLAQLEPWIAAGVPVPVSLAWGYGDLTGAPIGSSSGHLMVLVGFDAAGNPVVNDPAAASDGDVQRTYERHQFESLWLEKSGGTAYLIYPPDWLVPSSYSKGWNLVAGPGGTIFSPASTVLYTFQGERSYMTLLKTQGAVEGWGYWAYFPSDATVTVNGPGGNSYSTTLEAGQFRMVGNPSGLKSATVAADVIYIYDPVRGYASYQGSATLGVGRGAWVYSASGCPVTVTVQ